MARQAICISHASGAEGVAVAKAVAEGLDFQYVDEEVISEAAEWADLDPAFVADAERRKPFVARLLGVVGEQRPAAQLPTGLAQRSLPSDADVRHMITRAVDSYVKKGSVVIVAHAASFAVDGDHALRVLVTGSAEKRAQRLAAERGVDARAAERLVKDEDAGRASYLKRFYGVDLELPTHFDVVLNTDSLSTADAASAIIAAA